MRLVFLSVITGILLAMSVSAIQYSYYTQDDYVEVNSLADYQAYLDAGVINPNSEYEGYGGYNTFKIAVKIDGETVTTIPLADNPADTTSDQMFIPLSEFKNADKIEVIGNGNLLTSETIPAYVRNRAARSTAKDVDITVVVKSPSGSSVAGTLVTFCPWDPTITSSRASFSYGTCITGTTGSTGRVTVTVPEGAYATIYAPETEDSYQTGESGMITEDGYIGDGDTPATKTITLQYNNQKKENREELQGRLSKVAVYEGWNLVPIGTYYETSSASQSTDLQDMQSIVATFYYLIGFNEYLSLDTLYDSPKVEDDILDRLGGIGRFSGMKYTVRSYGSSRTVNLADAGAQILGLFTSTAVWVYSDKTFDLYVDRKYVDRDTAEILFGHGLLLGTPMERLDLYADGDTAEILFRHGLLRGWNFKAIDKGMVGKSLNEFKGDCTITSAYGWDPSDQKWAVLPNNTKLSSVAIGTGLVIKTTNDCLLNIPSEDVRILFPGDAASAPPTVPP